MLTKKECLYCSVLQWWILNPLSWLTTGLSRIFWVWWSLYCLIFIFLFGLALTRKFSMGRPGTNPSTTLKKDDSLSTYLLDARVGRLSLCLMLVMQPGSLDL